MKEFDLLGMAAHFATIAESQPRMSKAALEFAGQIVHAEAQRVIGTYDYGWPRLLEATIERKGADTPLLETGELRDSIRHKATSTEVYIGSNNDKAVWHELGTVHNPPRSFLAGALHAKIGDVLDVIGATIATGIATGQLVEGHDELERLEMIVHGARDAVEAVRHAAHAIQEHSENVQRMNEGD